MAKNTAKNGQFWPLKFWNYQNLNSGIDIETQFRNPRSILQSLLMFQIGFFPYAIFMNCSILMRTVSCAAPWTKEDHITSFVNSGKRSFYIRKVQKCLGCMNPQPLQIT